MRKYFIATALEDISISSRHATSQVADSLDYIPGSSIMGALASKLYKGKDSDNQLWSVFQNNTSVFSNCLPLFTNDEDSIIMGLPAPMAIHYKKSEAGDKNKTYYNRCAMEQGKDQLVQQRTGYIDYQGQLHSVEKGDITRTAISDSSFSAQKGSLFTQSYIRKGQQFLGFVNIDDDNLNEEYKSKINNFFNQSILIGKSRSTEFGKVQLKEVTLNDIDLGNNYNPVKIDSEEYVFFWCISNCEFYNLELGQNSPTPLANNLFIDSISQCSINDMDDCLQYDAQKSFIRNINVRYFNRKRGGFDSEKSLVQAGSVLAFKIVKQTPNLTEQLKQIAIKGIGFSRNLGLGQVVVNPSWIEHKEIGERSIFQDIVKKNNLSLSLTKVHDQIKGLDSNQSLLNWLQQKNSEQNKHIQADIFARKEFSNIVEWYRRINYFNTNNKGPSSTQWNEVKNVVYKYKDNEIIAKLKDVVTPKSDEYGWGAKGCFINPNLSNQNESATTTTDFGSYFLRNLENWIKEKDGKNKVITLLEKVCAQDLSDKNVFEIVKNQYPHKRSNLGK